MSGRSTSTSAATGQTKATTVYPGTNGSAVMLPVTSFQDSQTNFGPGKKALVTLTVKQANLQVTANGETVWYPPAPPPNNPCAPGHLMAGVSARATPVTANAAPGC